MECTQRLDFELSQTQTERTCPEQIGFLGILGTKYPVKRGPNKIGRDPQTCNIVLNLNSISRQHAVLNVLNARDFMLMDLDSANRTRINNKSLQAYIPVAISNGDTLQFGEVFGVFRLLEEDTDLPSTQAVDVPDTPLAPRHPARVPARQATVPESPDVSDKDDSFIMPSQPKPQNKFRGPGSNFIKSSSKTISIQPIGTNKIDNVYWNSSKKSNSFILDDSSNSLNESNQNGDILEKETQPPNDSTDFLYTAETQLPSKCGSIHSQDTQMPNNDNIFDAETQLPKEISPKSKIDESLYEATTQLPCDPTNAVNNDNIFEVDTQLPSKTLLNKDDKHIHDMETQVPFPINKVSTDSIYMIETQLPALNASPSIYSQETQLPKYDDCEVGYSSKSIYDVNTQLQFEEPNVSSKRDDIIFDAETQLSNRDNASNSSAKADKSYHDAKENVHQKQTDLNEIDGNIFNAATQQLTVQTLNVSIDLKDKLTDKTDGKIDKSDEVILFNEVDTHDDFDDLNASQPILGGDILQIKEDSEEIPLSQSDTITDDDFEIRLEDTKTEVKPAERDARPNLNILSDEILDFLPTQKVAELPVNEDADTDCEEDDLDSRKSNEPIISTKTKSSFDDLATQVIPEAGPSCHFDDLPTQIIPEINVNNDNIQNSNKKINEPNFEDMLTQVIPEDGSDKVTNFEDLPTQLIAEDIVSKPSIENLQFSEEVLASPFKIPLQTPLKIKKKDIPNKISNLKNTKSLLARSNTNNVNDEKYYAETQEIFDDLCSQQDSPIDRTVNNNLLKTKGNKLKETRGITSSMEDSKVAKVTNFKGEMEISVKNFARESSSESSDGEEKVSRFLNNLSAKQISDVIGADVTVPKRVPSDPSDVDVTPKKVRPGKFMETLLPDSQEIKTSVSLSTKIEASESSSESEKESQEQTPIVFRKKKRAKADVRKDLSSKFDIQALPTRVITRTRKPTSKVQENEAENKKRGRNILKPKFLNDSEQDEVDTEIISENITRLRNKTDKKNHKDTSGDGEKIQKVKTEHDKRKSNEENLGVCELKADQDNKNKSKNNSADTVVDLTVVNEEKPKSRRKNAKSKNTKNIEDKSKQKNKSNDDDTTNKIEGDNQTTNKEVLKKSKCDHEKSKNNTKDTVVDLTMIEEKPKSRRNNGNSKNNKDNATNITIFEKVISKHKLDETETSKEESQETRKIGRSRKKDVQDKITNYTVTTDESKISNTIRKVDESLNTTDDRNSASRTMRSNKDISNREKSVQEEHETVKRKRGRPKKEDKDIKKDSKDKKEIKDKKDSKETKRRKSDDKHKVEQPEIRRSRRQKITKDDSQSTSQNHEQSTVYSLSSESSVDSPKRKRRDVTIDAEAPTSKRTRSNTGSVLVSSDTSSVCTTETSAASSLRSTPSRAVGTHHVLFTAYPNEEVKAMLEKLGAVIVQDVRACTVVLTLQLRRTFKLLCAVGLGRPIVGPVWVQACHDHGTLVDPWQYILRDAASEARFGFSLPRTLRGARGYLRGYYVSATPSVLPSAPEMKLIVECSGGVWLGTSDGSAAGAGDAVPAGRWLCVSCAADRALHSGLEARGAALVSSELVLSGVLRQCLDVDTHRLK